MSDITYRKAHTNETDHILELMADIFTGEQGIPREDVIAFIDKDPVIWCAVKVSIICGAVAAWKENGETHWGRFVISADMRGKHIGINLAKHSLEDIFKYGTEKIIIEARDSTTKIIRSLGGIITGDPFIFYSSNVTPLVLYKEN